MQRTLQLATIRRSRAGKALAGFLVPSIADWVFVSLLCWLFFAAAAAGSLLADGDTGWHIRTGEHILATGEFPHQDLFSFSMEGETWFAWEWLADVVLAVVHGWAGLAGVVLLGGAVIAATAAFLMRYMLWHGANILLAIVMMFMACSASVVHWLARPHMFTWGFFLATIWLLEADRRRPSKRIYLLVPLVILWTNTHGGFVALLVSLAVWTVGTGIEELWVAWRKGRTLGKIPPALRRYGLIWLLCLAATLVNPYGYHLHEHIGGYLQSDFILEHVQEFQSPDFRGESMVVYEGLLILSILLCGRLIQRRQVAPALLVLAWAHASLVSVRHMPLFMIVAVPLIARELTLFLEEGARRGNPWLQGLRELADDYGGRGGATSEAGRFVLGWFSLAGLLLVGVMLHTSAEQENWKAEFPTVRFPAMACDSLEDRLKTRRLLTMDQWGDYLIYRFYPNVEVFIDGRSDFYAPSIRDDYLKLLEAHWDWKNILDHYGFEAAFIPVDWTLASALKVHPDWRLDYDDGFALYFERINEAPTPRETLPRRAVSQILQSPQETETSRPSTEGGRRF